MPNMKVLKDPGFLYDLNYLFYSKFNMQFCIDALPDASKKEAYTKYLKEIQRHFGDISEDLYVFYHAIDDGHCFMTAYYVDLYKDHFAKDFDFKYLKKLLTNTDQLIQNLIRFYLSDLSEEELAECMSSMSKLFACIKESDYSGDEKSKLYEFFINPTPYLQALQYELIEKEILLSAYYKENYGKIIEAHNNTTFEMLCAPVKCEKDLSVFNDSGQVLYTSYCLLHRYLMKWCYISEGVVYLLGFDYASIISEITKSNEEPPLENLCAALGETSRMRILELLLERNEITCKDLEKAFNISGSTAYHHITLLTRIGAVKIRNESKTIYYSLNRKYFDTMRELLKKFSNN